LRRAVDDAGGDRRLAAQRLGIGLSSLYRKLEELQPGNLTSGDALAEAKAVQAPVPASKT
ncbi:MAG: hypothetical protein IH606_09015, partial [Burkholderiales bacterium]|nr:hypothetical protein [Burkholderiales bacterium]